MRIPCVHVLCVFAVIVAVTTAQTPPPPVPGVGGSDVPGIGSGFDASKLDVYGLKLNPMAPVVEMSWCPDECYTPAHEYDPDCEYCQFSLPDYPNMTYRVPQNVFVNPETQSGGCYEQHTNSQVEDYEQMVGHSSGGGGWFSSWSKVTEKFYGMYYKTDSSLSLQTKHIIWYSLQMLPASYSKPKPTFEFTETMELLAQDPTYNYTKYKENVIDQFGTHYMTAAHVGGSAVMTAYFHSCFLEQFGGSYVFDQSSSSFLGMFSHGSEHAHGFNKTDSKFKQWSHINVTLVGGFADQYGTLNWTHFLSTGQAQAWEDSVKYQMLPLQYSLEPVTSLITNTAVRANVQKAFEQYGADVKAFNVGVVKGLVPQDPYTKPPWCKFAPHPPAFDVERSSGPKDNSKLLQAAGLPSCPSLPSDEDALAELARRSKTSA